MYRRTLLTICALTPIALTCSRAATRLVHLHVFQNGHVRFDDGKELDLDQFRAQVKVMMREVPRPDIFVEPDKDTPYAAIATVFSIFQQEGYGPHFGFVGFDKQK